ncbi:UPF0488 protein C8orf33 homolog isoform X3 [Ursus americanus]|uniref:UPF0488 protein C8orf33 homolog isoform X3 n=1 Tax=Ursus americanus TaxID=9643 RepID=UPI001E679CB4|nr:UPF0488 protein C8orf33 homolog isoform X3 [Ursus americanus]
MAALGQPSLEKSAAAGPGTARAPCSPRPPGSLLGAPSASAVRSHPVGLRLEPSTCSDTAPGVHPERRGGAAASKKQKKKKTRNGASVASGGGNVSEKPASEEAPLSAEAQARAGLRWEGWRSPTRPGCRAAGPGTGVVRGTVGAGPQDAETQSEAERAGCWGNPNPAQRKNPPAPEEAADALLVWGLQGSDGSPAARGPSGSQNCSHSPGAACR